MVLSATQLFERLQTWAERFPHRTASAGTTATLEFTYAALLTRARAVASHLRAHFPDDGSPVLVLGHKEPEGQDSQIKPHGCRTEHANIEANRRTLRAVGDCAVVPSVWQDAVQYLAALVVPSGLVSTDDLRAALAKRLPVYMVPRKFYLRDALPITANGKADHHQLADLAANGNRPPAP